MGSNIIEGTPGTKSHRPDDWKMPEIWVGMTVLWSYNTGGETSPAVVVSVGQRSVCLHVHVKDVKDHVIKTGTRHVGDPFLQRFPQHDGGCWRHTEFNERILSMLEDYESEVVDDEDDVPEDE